MRRLETVTSPTVFSLYEDGIENKTVVIIDILRATTTMVWAFHNGIKSIKPVLHSHEALAEQANGYLAAAEREGQTVEGFDMGNSPRNYNREYIEGKKVALTTTNGTLACHKAINAKRILIGSFLNKNAIIETLKNQDGDVLLFCAGWKGKLNLEDTLFAGAIAAACANEFEIEDDSSIAAMDLWHIAKDDLKSYLQKASHVKRFQRLGNNSDLGFSMQQNITDIVPEFKNNIIQ
jgi:2-phosphosulfolactate phosphatase